MAQESVLEFRIGEELYCFNTKIVKYVFDLEHYEELRGFDEVVLGLVHYDDDAMLLVDTLFLYTKERHIEINDTKSVIVIEDEQGALYGMVVDEIVKIEDVEPAPSTLNLSSEELIVHHYKEQEKLINEVVPLPLLHAKNIPSFKKDVTYHQEESQELTNKEQEEFLLFMIAQKLFAIATSVVKEVVEKESDVFELEHKSTRFKGAVAVRDDVYKVANIKPSVTEGNELIVVEKENECFCIEVDRVFGVEYFDIKKIDILVDTFGYIRGFYNKGGEVVALIEENFFISRKKQGDEDLLIEEKSSTISKTTQHGYLIFKVGDKEFALDMENVRQVIEKEELPHTNSSAISAATSSNVVFITEWNHHGIDVLSLNKIIGVHPKEDPSEVIMIETEQEKYVGVLVEKVDDIYYTKLEDIAMSADSEALISATIFKDQRVIAVINPKRVVS